MASKHAVLSRLHAVVLGPGPYGVVSRPCMPNGGVWRSSPRFSRLERQRLDSCGRRLSPTSLGSRHLQCNTPAKSGQQSNYAACRRWASGLDGRCILIGRSRTSQCLSKATHTFPVLQTVKADAKVLVSRTSHWLSQNVPWSWTMYCPMIPENVRGSDEGSLNHSKRNVEY